MAQAESVVQAPATAAVVQEQPGAVRPSEATLSEFDDIDDSIIAGMNDDIVDEDETQGDGRDASQPGVGLSAHEDEDTTTEAGEQVESAGETDGESTEQETTQETQEATQQQQPVVEETAEQKAARELEVSKARDAYVAQLEKTYQLSDEDAKTALLEPEKVLPRMAANLHARVLQEVVQQVQLAMPTMLQQFTSQSSVEAKAASDFYGQWPGLNKPEYKDAIMTAGKMYRQLNPKADAKTAIAAIGKLVCSTLDLDATVIGAKGSPAPAKAGGGKTFKPAQSTGGARAQPRAAPKKPDDSQPDWGDLAKDE